MDLLNFNVARCTLCGECIQKCPFQALRMNEKGIEVSDNCRMCGVCVRNCPQNAISFEQKAGTVDKSAWNDFLIYIEIENGTIHPVSYELIGEARKLAVKVGYKVKCVMVGPEGTASLAQNLLPYGIDEVFIYEHPGFEGLKADCYADAVADCIANCKPSSVLIGATSFGRSMAPRLSTRFHTGLTADCTTLDIMDSTDMVQIRPAFGGNIMAQILISDSRPQFATVRYRVMDAAKPDASNTGKITICPVSDAMVKSGIKVISETPIPQDKSIEEEDILVVAGRGVKDKAGLALCQQLSSLLGGQLAFTRPMIENGIGDVAHQIGLSGRTVRPKLLITCGVSGAIQFTSCIKGADYIISIDANPAAQIFQSANYCVVDDLYQILPQMITKLQASKEDI